MPSITVQSKRHDEGRLGLGRYQRVVLLEFEGPRERTISLTPSG